MGNINLSHPLPENRECEIRNINEHAEGKTDLFSFFKPPITNLHALSSISIGDVYKKLISPEYKVITELLRHESNTTDEQSNIKKNKLPYVTFSAEIEGIRNQKNTKNHSSYICIDADNLPNVSQTRQQILSDKKLYPELVFISPRGNGLKIVYCIPELKKELRKHNDFYKAIQGHFKTNYGIETDSAPKNMASACFLCYDPEAYHRTSEKSLTDWDGFLKSTSATKKILYKVDVWYADKLSKSADKFLPRTNCHYNDVTSFIGKNINDGTPEADTLKFLMGNAEIYKSSDTLYNNPEAVQDLVKRLYNNYTTPVPSTGCIQLSPKEFAYGLYRWKLGREGLEWAGIYRGGIINLLIKQGFRKITQPNKTFILVKVLNNIVDEVNNVFLKDSVKGDIDSLDCNIEFIGTGPTNVVLTVEKLREDFLTSAHTIFNTNFLSALPEHSTAFLKDTDDTMYFPFSDTVAVITKDSYIEFKPYSELEGLCVWRNRIIDHDVRFEEDRGPRANCHFAKFIDNIASGDSDRIIAFRTAIGYMLHNFNRPSDGQAVILNDEAITNTTSPMGGSGKGLFINSLREMRDVCKLDGKGFNSEERFCFQSVRTSTQIIAIDDLKPKTPFSRFFSVLTEGFVIERKNMEAQHIALSNSPKLLLSSNYVIESEGTSNKRRQFVLEFSDHYSSKIKKGTEKPIIEEHGCTFFSPDWDDTEWDSFYSYMLESCSLYLQVGLIGCVNKNLGLNRMKQTCGDDYFEWATDRIERGELKKNVDYNVKDLYEEYKCLYYGEDDNSFKQNKFSVLLKKMAKALDWEGKTNASNNIRTICFK